jgi:hypothetical protein
MKCPYCEKKHKRLCIDDFDCRYCNERIKVVYSDGFQHSLRDIHAGFSDNLRMGELKAHYYRKDQFFCSKCGFVSSIDFDVCPGFIKYIVALLGNPISLKNQCESINCQDAIDILRKYIVNK